MFTKINLSVHLATRERSASTYPRLISLPRSHFTRTAMHDPVTRHLVIGDLDHGEYDSIIPVLSNASARDLQRYVDALLSLIA